MPGWSSLFSNPEMFNDSTVAMVMGILLMVFPVHFSREEIGKDKRGDFLLDWKTVETRMPWGILLLFGGGFALASGFTKTGLTGWIGDQLTVLSSFPLWVVVLCVC